MILKKIFPPLLLLFVIASSSCNKLEQDDTDTAPPVDQNNNGNGGNNGGNTNIFVTCAATYWTHEIIMVSVGFSGVAESEVISRGAVVGSTEIPSNATGNPFVVTIENLNHSQNYAVMGYIETSGGKIYSSPQFITTLPYGITNINADQVGGSSANFTITFEGSQASYKGLYIGQNSDPSPSNGAQTFYGQYQSWNSTSYSVQVTGLVSNTTYYVKPYMASLAGAFVYGPIITITTGAPFNLQLGDSYRGGRIFYIDNTGEHGLIAANQNISSAMTFGNTWLATSSASGLTNTNNIVSGGGTTGNYAALACYNYSVGSYDDWHLPSLDELHRLHDNQQYVLGFNNTPVYNYWSSSCDSWNVGFAHGVDFATGQTVTAPSNTTWAVRAVQAF